MRIIGGKFKGKEIQAPKGAETRPTSSRLREAIFNICQFQIEGARFLDLFAGSGAMGLEALSRGAKQATFVDLDTRSLQRNLDRLGVQAQVMRGDVMEMLDRLRQEYDIIYVDPPYSQGLSIQVLQKIDQSSLLAEEGMLFIEEAKGSDLELVPLQTLEFVKSRRVGRSVLYQWRKSEEGPISRNV